MGSNPLEVNQKPFHFCFGEIYNEVMIQKKELVGLKSRDQPFALLHVVILIIEKLKRFKKSVRDAGCQEFVDLKE